MKLEYQVAGLDLCRKLKELGVKQDSIWYWFSEVGYDNSLCCPGLGGQAHVSIEAQYQPNGRYCSAFTVAELGEMLPFSLDESASSKDYRDLKISKNAVSNWLCNYVSQLTGSCMPWTDDKNLANAMAKMLIYLIENKIIEASK